MNMCVRVPSSSASGRRGVAGTAGVAIVMITPYVLAEALYSTVTRGARLLQHV